MNVLLANFFWEIEEDLTKDNMRQLQFPTGLAIIAAEIMRNRKDDLFVVDNYISKIDNKDVISLISQKNIDCILLSAYLGNYQFFHLKQFVNQIAENHPNCKIIIGGPLASTAPYILLKNISAHDEQVILVIGEGEITIIDLLNCIESKSNLFKVKGICFIKNHDYCETPARPRIKNLDEYPYPAYDLFDIKKYVEYVNKTNRCWEICTSRGCYGHCVFCKRVFGNNISMKSATYIVREMEDFSENYGINKFNFVDDNFLNSEKHVFSFYEALKKSNHNFIWRFQGRADRFTPTMAAKLIQVGLYSVSFGIESGSPIILQEMNKKIDIQIARNNLKSLPEELDTHASFIIGMPRESHETINQTIQFIKSVNIRNINAGILTIFPGTELYNQARLQGLIKNEDDYCSQLGPVYVYPYINLTSYSNEQLLKWRDMVSNVVL